MVVVQQQFPPIRTLLPLSPALGLSWEGAAKGGGAGVLVVDIRVDVGCSPEMVRTCCSSRGRVEEVFRSSNDRNGSRAAVEDAVQGRFSAEGGGKGGGKEVPLWLQAKVGCMIAVPMPCTTSGHPDPRRAPRPALCTAVVVVVEMDTVRRSVMLHGVSKATVVPVANMATSRRSAERSCTRPNHMSRLNLTSTSQLLVWILVWGATVV